jgi:hypothetical protein
MVSGSRFLGKCSARRGPCGAALNHRFDMDAAFRVHLHAAAARGETIELFEGGAEGADRLAREYWETYQLGPVHTVEANWKALGKRAGAVRNGLLVAHMPDLLIAFPWAGGSPGTQDAIRQARAAGIPEKVYTISHICPIVEAKLR